MSSNICGNCENFKPEAGDKFFKCTSAEHAGVKYGMQVRADTQACDAFAPFKPSAAAAAPVPPTERPLSRDRREPVGLCPWVKVALLIALLLLILLLSWLLYRCAIQGVSEPAPTPTPAATAGPFPTGPVGPTPTPVPAYTIDYYDPGEWAVSGQRMVLITSAERDHWYPYSTMNNIGAPAGTYFVMVKVTVLNRGSSGSIIVNPAHFVIIDSEGYAYNSQMPRQPYLFSDLLTGEVRPGKSGSGRLLFVVPSVATGLELQYLLDQSVAPTRFARWKLQNLQQGHEW
jgi:hypothetical protein